MPSSGEGRAPRRLAPASLRHESAAKAARPCVESRGRRQHQSATYAHTRRSGRATTPRAQSSPSQFANTFKLSRTALVHAQDGTAHSRRITPRSGADRDHRRALWETPTSSAGIKSDPAAIDTPRTRFPRSQSCSRRDLCRLRRTQEHRRDLGGMGRVTHGRRERRMGELGVSSGRSRI